MAGCASPAIGPWRKTLVNDLDDYGFGVLIWGKPWIFTNKCNNIVLSLGVSQQMSQLGLVTVEGIDGWSKGWKWNFPEDCAII
jgi:hypothetical protein